MALELNPAVKYNLQQHLIRFHHRSKSPPALNIGTSEQLSATVKISDNKTVSQCFGWDSKTCSYQALSYPELPKRNYLVACVDRFINVHVFAIYSLNQMNQMQAELGSGCVNGIDWKVLEIPEDVESELLKWVHLERGVIATPGTVQDLLS